MSTESTAVQFNQQGETYLSQGKLEEAIASCEQALKIHPNFAPAYKTLGNVLQAQGRMEEARHWYAKAIEIEPNFAEVYANLGSIYAQQEKWSEAIEFYQKAIAIKPNFAGVYRNLAKVFGQISKPAEAQQCWYQAFSLEPEKVSPAEHLSLGDALFRQEKFPEAIACYQRTIKLDPNLATAYQNLGEALKKQGKLDEATPYYRRAIELNAAHARNGSEGQQTLAGANGTNGAVKSPQVQPQIAPQVQQAQVQQQIPQEILRKIPQEILQQIPQQIKQQIKQQVQRQQVNSTINIEDPEAYKILAEGYFAQGKMEQAISACKKALQIKPEAPLYKMLGNALQAGGKIDEAKSCYVKAIEINPNFAEAYANYGSICAQQEQWQQAVSAYEKAIALKPDFAGAFRNFAKLLTQLGKSEAAAEALYRAFAIDPKSGTAEEHENLAKTLIEQGKVNKGIDCYQRAVELNPNAGAAYHELGELLKNQEHWEAAVDAYSNAIRINPDLSWSHNNLAESLVKLERWEESVNAYRRAIALNPDFSWSHNNLADVLLKLERWEEAVEAYTKATVLNPDFSWSHNYLADALIKLERWDEAIAAYQRSIELNPDHFWAHNNLAEALVNLERWDEAVVAYRRANEINPNFFWSHSKLGDVLLELERWDEAIEIYRRAAELNRDFAWTYYNMGTAFEKLERWDESIAAYRCAVEIQPDLPWISQKLADALRMRSQWDLRDAMGLYRKAIQENRDDVQLYHKALEIAPNDADLYVELANALVRHSWPDGAIVFYQMALQIRPGDAEISRKLENVLKKKNDLDELIAHYRYVIKLDQSSYLDYYYLGEALTKQEHWDEAVACYRRAFQLNPKTDTAWCYEYLGGNLANQGELDGKICFQTKVIDVQPDVTVVVPIFNAYEDTKKCLESLFKYTDCKHQILIVNDASTDERITELTTQCSSHYPQVTLITNAKNLGFVKTCNLAFKTAIGRDIILVNSDTVLTANWLENLILAAYSDPKIATVTPLTNNGTICSVPSWLQENNIPPNQTIDSFADLINQISWRHYPTVPTGVGFCMYIKREVLNKVGYFDELNFGKGYGEENDFCYRAAQKGYSHIIDDSTFVYHAGSKSFGSEKQEIVNVNLQQMSKLHPTYLEDVGNFINARPFQYIIANIQLHQRLAELKRLSPICFILHNDTESIANAPLGGTEYHCAALIAEISPNRPVYTLYATEKETVVVTVFFKEEKFKFEFNCPGLKHRPYLSNHPDFRKTFLGILQYFAPSIIHIHHLFRWPLRDVVSVLKKIQIPYIVSTHDYYFICPSYNLLDQNAQFCFEYKSEAYCQQCSQSLFGEGQDLKQNWHSICQELFAGASEIISPSAAAGSYFAREYPDFSDKMKVIRHGALKKLENDRRVQFRTNNTVVKNEALPIKVAFVGNFVSYVKGSHLIIDLLEKVATQENLRNNFVFEGYGGCVETTDNSTMESLKKHIEFRGAYNRQELPELLKHTDVVILPAIWSETYSLVADEVLSLGIPIITTHLGAIAERVREYNVGWVSKSASTDALLEVLAFLASNPDELTRMKANVQRYPLISYETMAQRYLQEYTNFEVSQYDRNKSMKTDLDLRSLFVAYLKAKWLLDNPAA